MTACSGCGLQPATHPNEECRQWRDPKDGLLTRLPEPEGLESLAETLWLTFSEGGHTWGRQGWVTWRELWPVEKDKWRMVGRRAIKELAPERKP